MVSNQTRPQSSILEITVPIDSARQQVDRILASETLRGSEVLRHLLRFLANKTFAGEADQLKEYVIGLDALGKPPDYDPRRDAAVRLQASRLRQKLEEYYGSEGSNDPVVVELPRGRFKIAWRCSAGSESLFEPVIKPAPPAPSRTWPRLTICLAILLATSTSCCVWLGLLLLLRAPAPASVSAGSAPELDAIWHPFISSTHHLIIAFSGLQFARFQRGPGRDIWYRQQDAGNWDETVNSSEFVALSRLLGHPPATPTSDYATRSELLATFVLGQFLTTRRRDVSIAELSQLSWEQMAENDVIFIAPRDAVAEKELSLPAHLAFVADRTGIRNLQLKPGEPPVYTSLQPSQDGNGETYVLISLMRGPLGRTTVASFTGGGAWGAFGAIRSLMDPPFARIVVSKLKDRSGVMPGAYQMVLRIRYRDGTPTNVSYVTHRVLTQIQN